MYSGLLRLLLVIVLAITSLTALGQVVTATLPVGNYPGGSALNTTTNRVYVANALCRTTPCPGPGT